MSGPQTEADETKRAAGRSAGCLLVVVLAVVLGAAVWARVSVPSSPGPILFATSFDADTLEFQDTVTSATTADTIAWEAVLSRVVSGTEDLRVEISTEEPPRIVISDTLHDPDGGNAVHGRFAPTVANTYDVLVSDASGSVLAKGSIVVIDRRTQLTATTLTHRALQVPSRARTEAPALRCHAGRNAMPSRCSNRSRI